MENLRIIISGGGTGGHIFPALAIGHALQRLLPGTQLLFVGATGQLEMEYVAKEGYDIIGLNISGYKRGKLLANISLSYKVIKSRFDAKKIIKQFNPHAIIGVGGYASFPVMSAGQSMNVHTIIQEQNSYAGKANIMLGKKASAICVAYENMEKFFPKDKIFLTGNPVRSNISHMNILPEEAKSMFGLSKELKTIMVFGGSLGAKTINESIDENLENILSQNVQLIWQTGKLYYKQAMRRAEIFGNKVKVFEFIDKIEYAYTAADIVVSRAGALAISELCIAAKPVIFIPYPYAAEDHQTSNAAALVAHNAALLIKDMYAKDELFNNIKMLLNDTVIQDVMSKNLRLMAIKDADERIAKKIIEIINSDENRKN